MNTTWFEARSGFKIEPVEIVRETDKSLWLKKAPGVRVAKQGGWMAYFPTVEEAKNYLIQKAENWLLTCEQRLENAKTSVERAQASLENAKNIQVSKPIDLSKELVL